MILFTFFHLIQMVFDESKSKIQKHKALLSSIVLFKRHYQN